MDHPTKSSEPASAPTSRFLPAFVLTAPDRKPTTFYERNFSGLRANLRNFSFVTAIILAINIGWLAWAHGRYGIEEGLGTIQQGDCAAAKRTSLLLHLLINILSSILLAASNAFVQAYSSPSRAEVDAAHRRGDWLHIGAMSWRNLRKISKRKAAVCIVLLLSSVPFHLLYNSLVFISISTTNYMFIGVSPDFFEGASFAPPSASWSLCQQCKDEEMEALLYLRDLPGTWDKLEPADCIKNYINYFQNDRRHVFLVSHNRNATNSLFYSSSQWPSVDDRSFFWMCSKDRSGGPNLSCSPEDLLEKIRRGEGWEVYGQPVSHCLAERVTGECAVHFHYGIMVAVLVFNAVKLLAMVFITYRFKAEHLLATVGDAVSSFLHNQDPTTMYMCLASDRDIKRFGFNQPSRFYTNQPQRRYQSVSKRRWFTFISLLLLSLATGAGFLGWGLSELRKRAVDTSISGLWSFGLGTVDARALVTTDPNTNTGGMAMLANLPQIFLASIYLAFNPLMSLMFSAVWWASLASSPRSLLVSSPSNQQKGPPLLGMHIGWGLPLLALHSLLHWLCSQSLFLVHAKVWEAADKPQEPPRLAEIWAGCGYSPIGAILTIVAGLMLLFAGLAIGYKKLAAPAPPLVGNSSAAISASCHPGQYAHEVAVDDTVSQVQWGVIRGWIWPDGRYHCSIVPVRETDSYVGVDSISTGVSYA